jgi:5-methylcytosine-specific restriction endonuclease McrA
MKRKIPAAIRQQVWLTYCGKRFEYKCAVIWCTNVLTPFTFEVGHNVPESKGGLLELDNLKPLCSNCNKSMGSTYTIDEFSAMYKKSSKMWECFKFSAVRPE